MNELQASDRAIQSSTAKTLSIVIPVYNEVATVTELLDRVLAAVVSTRKEIIIVNDGSTDDSPAHIRDWAAGAAREDCDIVVVDKENGGKGSAVRTGIEKSTGDVVIIQDADLEYDPNDYQKCIEPILSGDSKVVYGSRERRPENRMHSSLAFYAGGLAVTYWMNLLFGSSMTDEPTCYKTFDGPLIRALLFDGDKFDWEPEITAKLLRLGYDIAEVPVSYAPRKVDEGKKINWRDGVAALWVALLWRFRPLGNQRAALEQLPAELPQLQNRRKSCNALLTILVICFIVRLAAALPGTAHPEERFFRYDTATYTQSALALKATGAIKEHVQAAELSTLRVPGYIVFLAAIFTVTDDLRLLAIGFCLLSALVCIPIFRVGTLFGGRKVGAVAALLYTFNITSIAHAPMFLSDTLFALVAAWMLFFFSRFYFKARLIDLWLAIALNGVATLIRPLGLMWLVPCCFLVLIYAGKSCKKRILGIAGCVIIFLLIITPWMYRNHCAGGGFRLGTNIGSTLYYHNCAALMSVVTGTSAETLRQSWQAETDAVFAADPETYATSGARTDFQLRKARSLIGAHKLTYIRLHIQPPILYPDAPTFLEILGQTRTGQGTLDILHRQGTIAAVKHYFGDKLWLLLPLAPLLLLVAFTYLGCALQLCRWLLARQWFLGFFFLAFVVYYLLLPGPIVMPRYQLPALPLMTVMAAIFWLDLWQRYKRTPPLTK